MINHTPALYLLQNEQTQDLKTRVQILSKACEKLQIPCVLLDRESNRLDTLPVLESGDMLYNVGRGPRDLECMLLSDKLATFYRDVRYADFAATSTYWSVIHQKLGVPTPKTIPTPGRNRDSLKSYVEYLGGFPLILKVAGGTRGIGVLLVESYRSLITIVDLLHSQNTPFLLREFIESDQIARIYVLNGQTYCSLWCHPPEDDFRTALADNPRYTSFECDPRLGQVAIQAVEAIGTEFGGVDLIVDRQGNPKVLEVNFPCGFNSVERVTGRDIALSLVTHLKQKSDRILSGSEATCCTESELTKMSGKSE